MKLIIEISEDIYNSIVKIDDETIGFVQSIKIELDVKNELPKVEIVFPDLTQFKEINEDTVKAINNNIERLKKFSGIKIEMKTLNELERK